MSMVLLKITAYLVMIALGYGLKRTGFFHPTDFRVVSNIVMNITLPAAVITSFASMAIQTSMIFIVALGLACNLVMLGVGALLSRRRSLPTRTLFMMNMPGYNIGTFTMPYVQSFMGPQGVAMTSLFDTGNAIMVAGGTFAIISHVLRTDGTFGLKSLFKILRSSLPFITYVSMLILVLLKIRIPAGIIVITGPIGAANTFLAMLMIGLMFEIRLDAAAIKKVGTILLFRFLGATALALLFYYLTPFPLAVRQALAIAVFSPISTLAPLFTQRGNGDGALSSLALSLSILISLFVMSGLILVMGIG